MVSWYIYILNMGFIQAVEPIWRPDIHIMDCGGVHYQQWWSQLQEQGEPSGPEESRPKALLGVRKTKEIVVDFRKRSIPHQPSMVLQHLVPVISEDSSWTGPATPHLRPRRSKHASLCLLRTARVPPCMCSFYRASLVVIGCITEWHQGCTTSWRKMLDSKVHPLGHIQLWPELWQPLNSNFLHHNSLSNFLHIIFASPLHTEAISPFHTLYSQFTTALWPLLLLLRLVLLISALPSIVDCCLSCCVVPEASFILFITVFMTERRNWHFFGPST